MQPAHNLKSLKTRRKSLRSALTPAEAALWRVLQRAQLQNKKFRRQHSIGPYIVDFYCPAERLAVELDGSAHDVPQAAMRDQDRDQFLRNAGIEVLRIENRAVFENLEGVLLLIAQHFKAS